jgi:uncharacterized protein involved in response to NO
LAALAGLWLPGRIACLVSALMPAWLVIAADLSFPVLLVAVIAREIIVAKNWRNLPLVAPLCGTFKLSSTRPSSAAPSTSQA